MPVEHIVFFKLKPLTEEQFLDIQKSFVALKDLIPGILEISFGKNISQDDAAAGFDHALRVLFVDEASLRAYAPHAAHQAFVSKLIVFKEVSARVDWNV